VNEIISMLPADWSLDIKEVSPSVYRIRAHATDGRRIEAMTTEIDLERVTKEMVDSARDSDRQVAERFGQAR
jgi:sigma54-dependent transcription regulator